MGSVCPPRGTEPRRDMFGGLFSVAGLTPFQLADKEEALSCPPKPAKLAIARVVMAPHHTATLAAAPRATQHPLAPNMWSRTATTRSAGGIMDPARPMGFTSRTADISPDSRTAGPTGRWRGRGM